MRRLPSRIALLTGSVILAFLASEGVCRLVRPASADALFQNWLWLRTNFYREVPGRGYEVIPHAADEINGLGMRDAERAEEKPQGAARVLVLGDSVAYGIGVKRSETFSSVLEGLLREQRPNRLIEVLNAGAPGYNTEQELALLRERGLALGPDVVILAYCPNDIEVTPILYREGDRFRFYMPGTPRLLHSAFLVSHSALFRMALAQFETWRAQRSGTYRTAAQPGLGTVENRDANLGALAEMTELLKGKGIPFLVVVFPYLSGPFDHYDPKLREIHGQVRSILAKHGVDVIDLLDVWSTLDYASLRFAPRDFVHPNARGHCDAARRMAEWILAKAHSL